MYNLLCRINVLKNIKTNILLKHTRIRPIQQLSSTTSQLKVQQDIKSTTETQTWNRIYYFPYIAVAAFLNRFKLYQTTITIAAIPISVGMYNYGMMDYGNIGLVTGCAVLASLTLYAMTTYFRRLIGIIAITDDEKLVKISHLTFWGRRNDISVPLEDIIPLGDCDCNANDVYVKVKSSIRCMVAIWLMSIFLLFWFDLGNTSGTNFPMKAFFLKIIVSVCFNSSRLTLARFILIRLCNLQAVHRTFGSFLNLSFIPVKKTIIKKYNVKPSSRPEG